MIRFAMVGLLTCVSATALAQQPAPTDDLATLLHDIPLHTDNGTVADSYLMNEVINRLQTAPLPEVQANLPTLLALTESSDDDVRSAGLLALMNMGFTNFGNQQISAVGNAVPDLAADDPAIELLVPYIPKLLCLMSRGTPTERAMAFATVQQVAHLKPVPPALIQGLLRLLADSSSTLPLATLEDQLRPGTPPNGPSLGPQLLWILLPAAATTYHDPLTKVTVAWDSPEVQDAVLAFLNREDQTPTSLAASIRALAFAEPQNPRVNAALVRLLDSSDPNLLLALVQQLPKLALTSDAYFVGRARVSSLVDDPNTSSEVRAAAANILPCWTNDRQQPLCPAPVVPVGN